MLRELAIRNFAIIDDLSIGFESGLTVLTGETGAGKSILINAINLIMGERASADLVRTSEETAELEALFEVPDGSEAAKAADAQSIDISEGLLIRRVIGRNGRHKVYINGRLGTGRMLLALNTYLVSISGQHAYQHLLREEEHLRLLDDFGGTHGLCRQVTGNYNRITPLIKRLDELQKQHKDQAERLELLAFQVEEIESAAVEPGEDEKLEREIQRSRHAERLYETIAGCMHALYEQDGAIVERLDGIEKEIDALSRFDERLGEMARRTEAASVELADLAEEMRAYLQKMTVDEQGLAEMESRLDVLQKLKRKYGGSLEAVLGYGAEARAELEEVTALPERIKETQSDLAGAEQALKAACRELSAERHAAARRLALAVAEELASLGMVDTRFEVRFTPIPVRQDTPSCLVMNNGGIEGSGSERAEFVIAPNVGEDLRPLAQIASGGELSRIVLAVKSILAKKETVETLIFDEVDAGIGGGIAEMVGRKLKALAAYHQVICITHLPQIACFGSNHFRIDKEISKGRTRTSVTVLDRNARVEELARMLGGTKVTAKTRAYAREMMSRRSASK